MNKATIMAALAVLALLPAFISAAQFSIMNSAWGTNSAAASPVAGQYGAPFTVTIQNLMCAPLKNVTFQLSTWGTGYATSNGGTASTQSIASVAANQQFSYTFYLNVPKNVSYAESYLSGELTWDSPSTLYTNCTTTPTTLYYVNTPDYFSIPIYFSGNAALTYRQSPVQLNSGAAQNVTLLVTNIGSGNATQLQATVSAQPGSHASVIAQPATIPSLSPGATADVNFMMSIPGNLTGSSIPLNISSSFDNGGSAVQTQKSSVSLSVSSKPAIVVVQNQTIAGVGGTTQLSIGITNNEGSPIYYVQASLAQQQMTTNSSGSIAVTRGNPGYYSVIEPGQTVWFTPSVTTSPSISEGGYGARLSIAYTSSDGASQTVGYNIGIIVAPRLAVALQGVTASRLAANSTGVQVAGNLLDIGSGNAYYAEVYAYLLSNGTVIDSNSTYVGEVLSDSPTAFSVVLSSAVALAAGNRTASAASGSAGGFSRNSTAFNQQNMEVEVYAVYQDDLGDQFKSNVSTYSVSSGGLFGLGSGAVVVGANGSTYRLSRSGSSYDIYIYIAVAAVIIVLGVYLYRRRSKRHSKKKERQVT